MVHVRLRFYLIRLQPHPLTRKIIFVCSFADQVQTALIFVLVLYLSSIKDLDENLGHNASIGIC